MSDPQAESRTSERWRRPAFLVLAAAAITLVLLCWFRTPEVRVQNADGEYTTSRCANAGPSRWDPPTVNASQELESGQYMVTFNQQVLKNDIDSIRVRLACSQARDAHTNDLIMASFAAAAILFFGYNALWTRRIRIEQVERAEQPVA